MCPSAFFVMMMPSASQTTTRLTGDAQPSACPPAGLGRARRTVRSSARAPPLRRAPLDTSHAGAPRRTDGRTFIRLICLARRGSRGAPRGSHVDADDAHQPHARVRGGAFRRGHQRARAVRVAPPRGPRRVRASGSVLASEVRG